MMPIIGYNQIGQGTLRVCGTDYKPEQTVLLSGAKCAKKNGCKM